MGLKINDIQKTTQIGLAEYNFPKLLDSSSDNLIKDFFEPALSLSIRYDRGVGFFSSGWLRENAKGMTMFAKNSGYARWVTSPVLNKDDWEALQKGSKAAVDKELKRILEQNIEQLEEKLEKETLSALSWLIADGLLDFKLALPRNKLDQGEFHDKFGIFTDSEGNQVSFNGSYNDSIQGSKNYESITIFCSWEELFTNLVKSTVKRFEKLWNNDDPNVRVFDLPEAAKEHIVRLRTISRPYPEPDKYKVKKFKQETSGYFVEVPKRPSIPTNILLREYQTEAIKSWFNNDCKGLLEMATGTGKTITALAAAIKKCEIEKRLILLILCPYKHLVEQWSEEAIKFNLRPIPVVENRSRWQKKLIMEISLFKSNMCDVVSIVSTNSSFQVSPLLEILDNHLENTMIIIDEAHHAGAPRMLEKLPIGIKYRLGLSATPMRHYDVLGTNAIMEYFKTIVFSFPLEKAIGKFLTSYYYYPKLVEMTEKEFSQYCNYTRQLQKYIDADNNELSEMAEKIAIKRARVINNSITKFYWLDKNIGEYDEIEYTLFYVGDKMFEDVTKLLGLDKKIRIHEFTQKQTNKQRKQILSRFEKGDLQALVAMKCLDEGVDVPPTKVAYFLASSGNPLEFVQRRGRILRKSKDKDKALIFDLISIPPRKYLEDNNNSNHLTSVKSALRREYKRVKEFASLAVNKYQALDEIFEIINKFNLSNI